ncbi:hypothetical protein VDGD_20856 [Verticillium dahliae]|nr:hypothetical protein VDGD_20856 [Verticillium dahliae]
MPIPPMPLADRFPGAACCCFGGGARLNPDDPIMPLPPPGGGGSENDPCEDPMPGLAPPPMDRLPIEAPMAPRPDDDDGAGDDDHGLDCVAELPADAQFTDAAAAPCCCCCCCCCRAGCIG